MRRPDHPRVEPRRIQHAHRIRRPVGPLTERDAAFVGRRRRRLRPGLATIAGLAVLAVALPVLRPWDAATGSDAGAAFPDPVASAPTLGRVVAEPTLGPHGDAVPRVDSGAADVPRRHDVWRAGTAGPLPPALLAGYQWPIRNARITNTYGLGRPGSFLLGGKPFHDGLDVSSFCGARITAAHDGVVLAAGRRSEAYLGWVGDLGPFRAKLAEQGGWGAQAITVVVDDGNGYRSIYAHLGVAAVEKGAVVRAGDLLGWQGASGNATGCHLHYAIFSPLEQSTLTLDPKIARKTRLPPLETARIDPLLVLPPLAEAGITWNWGAR